MESHYSMSSKLSVRGNQPFMTEKTTQTPSSACRVKAAVLKPHRHSQASRESKISTGNDHSSGHWCARGAGRSPSKPRGNKDRSRRKKRFSHQSRRSEALLCDRSYNNQNYERLLFYVVSEKAQPGWEGLKRQGRKSGRINMDIIMSDINFESAALNYLKWKADCEENKPRKWAESKAGWIMWSVNSADEKQRPR